MRWLRELHRTRILTLAAVGLSVLAALIPGSILGMGGVSKAVPASLPPNPSSVTEGSAGSPANRTLGGLQDSGSSTPTWVEEVSSRYHPSNRFTPGLTYDAAAGYVVLYGGWNIEDSTSPVNTSQSVYPFVVKQCLNDTWIYRAGEWTNLSIGGMPPSCEPAMAYDPVLQEVVAYFTYVNETWTFSQGRWVELQNLSNPYVCNSAPPYGVCNNNQSGTNTGLLRGLASMTYDPALRTVVLVTSGTPRGQNILETWEFGSTGWLPLNGSPYWNNGVDWAWPELSSPLTYDWLDGYATLTLETFPRVVGGAPLRMKLWVATSDGTNWTEATAFPMTFQFDNYFMFVQSVYDPALGSTLFLLGEHYMGWDPPAWITDQMWEFRNGSLQNVTSESSPPPSIFLSSTTFDGADGYVLMFGGYTSDPPGNYTVSNETWILGRPMSLEVKDSVQPGMVCPVTEGGCEAGTDTARVNVSISAVPFENGTASESQIGQLIRGPVGWAPELSMTFVGWGSIAPAPNLDPQVRCLNELGGQMGCPTDPAQSPGPGPPVLRWNWSEDPSMLEAGFATGDRWTIQFNVVALGPPFGVVPVDSCITTSCLADGSGPLGRLYSNYGYGQWESGTRVRPSLPLMEVGVLSPDVGSAPAPNPPPPPPVPIGVPVHVSTPSPTPVAPLQSLLIPTVAATGTPVTPILAGILAAGGMRAAIETRSRSLRVAVKVRRGIIPVDKQIPFRGPR